MFPDRELPQPIREGFTVQDQFELNELETVWMFRFHTWRGYEGGMNMTLPGSTDYRNIAAIGGQIAAESGQIQKLASTYGTENAANARKYLTSEILKANGRLVAKRYSSVNGIQSVESGCLAKARSKLTTEEMSANGRKTKERQLGIFAPEFDKSKGGRIGGRKATESGQLAKAREHCNYKKMGQVGGRSAVDTGQLAKARERCNYKKMGQTVNHNRWHLNRGISKPETCTLCKAAQEIAA